MYLSEKPMPGLVKKLVHLGLIQVKQSDKVTLPKPPLTSKEDSIDFEKEDASVLHFIHDLLKNAIEKKASDIHFEPYEKTYRIRFRIDGFLTVVNTPAISLAPRLATCLKVLAGLDISERRLPQDGRFKLALDEKREIDFRVSTCPTLFGEKIVLRLLDPTDAERGIDTLGLLDTQKTLFLNALQASQGLLLVTGPTGSGKTITLYTALSHLNTKEKNISTAEDPIEIYLAGINQVNIHPKIGLNFTECLRTFLRQDPDVIMVGEIRDLETAETAIKAAQTGHLVLSTLHTNSTTETLMRLMNMGIASYNLATSVNLIVAQRLVRRLCEFCKQPDNPSEANGDACSFRAVGCEHCDKGYRGRLGIFEMLSITPAIKACLLRENNPMALFEVARKEGLATLREAGLIAVQKGQTTLSEIERVTR